MTLALSALSFTIPSILVVLGFVIFYGNNGVLNSLLKDIFSLEESPVRFLYSFSAIIFAHVYLNLPVAFNLITNGWTSLPRNEEMASYTLGRGKMKTFFSITLPMITPTLLFNLITSIISSFQQVTLVMLLTGGGPLQSTYFYGLMTYNNAFKHHKMGYASANAWVMFIIILLLTALVFKSSSAWVFYESEVKANKKKGGKKA